jgi:hypothetical protein
MSRQASLSVRRRITVDDISQVDDTIVRHLGVASPIRPAVVIAVVVRAADEVDGRARTTIDVGR